MELIDGHAVVRYLVRFRDRTEITEAQATTVKDGNTMVWVVRTRCLPPSYHPVTKDSDERYRFNIQAVEAAVPVEADQARQAALAFVEHGDAQGYLNLGAETYPALFDAADYGPSQKEADLDRVARLLHETGNLAVDETVYDAVFRLLRAGSAAPASSPEPELPFERTPPPPLGYEPGAVEVVGSIYGSAGPSANQRLIEQMFSDNGKTP